MKLKKDRLVVSIETELGSNGSMIAKELAGNLGVPCYEKEILQEASRISRIPLKLMQRYEERIVRSAYDLTAKDESEILIPPAKNFLMAQIAACRFLAEQKSCVLVDHHSNAALIDRDDPVRVFIHADKEDREKQFAFERHIDPRKAKTALAKEERRRRRYFRSVSKKWGKASNYDLTVNSTHGSAEAIAGHIVDYLQNLTEDALVHPTCPDRRSA